MPRAETAGPVVVDWRRIHVSTGQRGWRVCPGCGAARRAARALATRSDGIGASWCSADPGPSQASNSCSVEARHASPLSRRRSFVRSRVCNASWPQPTCGWATQEAAARCGHAALRPDTGTATCNPVNYRAGTVGRAANNRRGTGSL